MPQNLAVRSISSSVAFMGSLGAIKNIILSPYFSVQHIGVVHILREPHVHTGIYHGRHQQFVFTAAVLLEPQSF